MITENDAETVLSDSKKGYRYEKEYNTLFAYCGILLLQSKEEYLR
jgi:hypothetical protein